MSSEFKVGDVVYCSFQCRKGVVVKISKFTNLNVIVRFDGLERLRTYTQEGSYDGICRPSLYKLTKLEKLLL